VPGVQHLLICPINKLEAGVVATGILHRVHKNVVLDGSYVSISVLEFLSNKKKVLLMKQEEYVFIRNGEFSLQIGGEFQNSAMSIHNKA
jgi:hypothetical protein